MCYLWDADLVASHVITDLVIFISYMVISGVLLLAITRVPVYLKMLFMLFVAFIFMCGVTHLASALIVYYPWWWFAAGLKAVTAGISLFAALQVYQVRHALHALLSRETEVPLCTHLCGRVIKEANGGASGHE